MPPGQVDDLGLRLLGELHELEQLVGAGHRLGLADAEVAGVDEEVLADVELEVEGVLLRADPQPGADLRAVGRRVQPEDRQLTAGRRGDRGDHPHRRGLAGAVGTEEPEGLPRPHVEVDARPPRPPGPTSPYDLRSPRAQIIEHGRRSSGSPSEWPVTGSCRGLRPRVSKDTRPTLRSTTDRSTPVIGSTATGVGGEDDAMTRDPRQHPSRRPGHRRRPHRRHRRRRSRCGSPRTAGTSRRPTGAPYDDRMPWGRQDDGPAAVAAEASASGAHAPWRCRPTSPTWTLPGRGVRRRRPPGWARSPRWC